MTAENLDFLTLPQAITELNTRLLSQNSEARTHSYQTAWAFAASGRIQACRDGRIYKVRRSDLPLIASKLSQVRKYASLSAA